MQKKSTIIQNMSIDFFSKMVYYIKENKNSGRDNMNAKEIIAQFNSDASLTPYGNGHINDTYVTNRLIIQRINTDIFKDADGLMKNIVGVTEHLRKKIEEAGGDTERETLTVVPTQDGKAYYKAEDGSCYRAYNLIEDSVSYEIVSAPLLYRAAKAFGKFQNMLDDYPADTLFEIIPNFHNTAKRYDNLMKAAENDVCGRLASVKKEFDFACARKDDTPVVLDAIEKGLIPLRVTHNDTKLNNVLFDNKTQAPVSVIDLDTVMPGSYLYDFGDAIRSGATHAAEDEQNLDIVDFDLDLYKAFAKGYIEQCGASLTDVEIELLPYASIMLTLECGIRFLTDHLNGDTYFKIHREGHNLDRCRTQFKLVYEMEQNLDKLKEIINSLVK